MAILLSIQYMPHYPAHCEHCKIQENRENPESPAPEFMQRTHSLHELQITSTVIRGEVHVYDLHISASLCYTFPMITRIREVTARYFADKTDVLAVFAFGSAITQSCRPESDIDLAVMMERDVPVSSSDTMKWIKDLSYAFARTVDLGEINTKSLVFSREALLTGEPVYVRDENRMAFKRVTILGMYLQYNIDRREVLDAYTKR